MKLLDELDARGLVHDVTSREGLAALLEQGAATFYCGFDPSGPSLHVGNLIPMSLMARLARAGHRPIAVIGGATGMIGDPSGRSQERRLLDPETLQRNVASVSAQIARIVPEAVLLDNADWTRMSYLEFLRDIGKHISVNTMLAKESVRSRLEAQEQGLSFTEFSYMLLQAWDFAHLAQAHDVRLQLGGSDQWGNITCGIELARKLGTGKELFGLVTPLLMTSAGTKFGKTEAGTSVWLDEHATSPYRSYQFWINADDADVERYLKLFTFIDLDEIAKIMTEHGADKGRRVAQRRLAATVTQWVHGTEAARRAALASEVMFGGSMSDLRDADLTPLLDDVPSSAVSHEDIRAGIALVELLVRTKLAESKGAARRLIQQGGVYLNNVRIDDPARAVGPSDLATESLLLVRAGKKSWHIVRAT